MQLLEQPVYRIADIEFDPARNCLRRGDQEQVLRQKSLLVLRYLIEHRERSVSKDELLQNVWEGVAVTDDALVQIIVELRKLLGDDSRQPRFIRTIPKAGYHFIGPVEELSASSIHLGQSAVIEIEETTSVQVEFEETLGPISVLATAPPPVRWLNRKPGLLAGLGGGLLIAVLALLSFGKRPASRTEIALPRVPGKRAVAVLYFENQSGDRELDWLREGLADMVITNLSRSRKLTVLSRQQLVALLTHLGRAHAPQLDLEEGLEIARRAQAEALIQGSFVRLGTQVRVDVRVLDARGQLQAAESLLAERPELLLAQIDLLALKLSAHLGAALPDADAQRGLAARMTNNLDAYRYYSLALEQAQMFQFPEAIALLEKAVALDPQFALAHARIGYVYAVKQGQGERAQPYLEKALQVGERLSERDRLYIMAWMANARRDPAQAIQTYRQLLAQYPQEVEGYQRLGWLLIQQGQRDEALQVLRQGAVIDPEWRDLYNALGEVYLHAGQQADAQAAYERYVQLAPNDPNAYDSLANMQQWFGRYDKAEELYQRALALNPESMVAILHLGHTYFWQGRYRAALEQYRRVSEVAPNAWQRGYGHAQCAAVYLKQGDLPRAAAAARQAMKYDKGFSFEALLVALAQGDRAAAAQLKPAFLTANSFAGAQERGHLRGYYAALGLVAWREGRTDEAVTHFQAGLRHRALIWNYDAYEDCLANAYLELGRADEAVAEYERILKINPHYPLAHYHLGQAYERKGERQQARAAYQRFLQVWQDADADIPEVNEAQARLSR